MYSYTAILSPSGAPVLFGSAPLVWRAVAVGSELSAAALPQYTREEYLQALAALLPTGHAWPRDLGSVVMLMLWALAGELQRVEARGAQLLEEMDPGTTAELLSDWERVAGLPDDCVTQVQTVAERRRALAGRLTSAGMQSRAFFVALAARLGYTVSIEEFASPAEATAAGVVFTGDQWAHIWRVRSTVAVGVTPFRVGASAVGEPLQAWGNEVLECQFERFKPAHTQVLFVYPT